MEAPGPLSEVTKPMVRSAAELAPADNANAATPAHKRDNMSTSVAWLFPLSHRPAAIPVNGPRELRD